jgi:hypothetical protein
LESITILLTGFLSLYQQNQIFVNNLTIF